METKNDGINITKAQITVVMFFAGWIISAVLAFFSLRESVTGVKKDVQYNKERIDEIKQLLTQ